MTVGSSAEDDRFDDLSRRISLQYRRLEGVLTQLAEGWAANQDMVAKVSIQIADLSKEVGQARATNQEILRRQDELERAIIDTMKVHGDLHGARLLALENDHGEKLNRMTTLVLALETSGFETANRWGEKLSERFLALENVHGEKLNRIATLALELQTSGLQTANRWGERLSERLLALEGEHGEKLNRIASMDLELQTLVLETANRWGEDLSRRLMELANRFHSGVSEASVAESVTRALASLNLAETMLALRNGQGNLANSIAESRLGIEKYGTETLNTVAHLNSSTHSRLNEVHASVLDADQMHEIISQQLTLRRLLAGEQVRRQSDDEKYQPASPKPFQAYLDMAQHDFPHVFKPWKERLATMDSSFHETKTGNAANSLDVYSRAFRQFVGLFAKGRVLDVGSGVFGRPFYLHDYPFELISEIEPLPLVEPADVEHVPGIGEYLPWPDQSFSTVISATSLDHCLSLETSLREIHRVLAANGRFLLWIGSMPGAPAYAPEREDFEPADRFHLFHFDAAWLEPILEESYCIVERVEMKKPSFSHVFYCLEGLKSRKS